MAQPDITNLEYLQARARAIPKNAEEAAKMPCNVRYCPTAEICGVDAQPCNTSADCYPTSCCSVIMLENVTGNIPGSAIPEGRTDRCNSTDMYCENRFKVCVVSEPSWLGFSDADAINVLQGKVPNPITEAQQLAIMAKAQQVQQQKLRIQEERKTQARIDAMRVRTFI